MALNPSSIVLLKIRSGHDSGRFFSDVICRQCGTDEYSEIHASVNTSATAIRYRLRCQHCNATTLGVKIQRVRAASAAGTVWEAA